MNETETLRTLIRDAEDRIRVVKRGLRSTWTRPMGDEQQELLALKRHVTRLLVTLAWRRGRLHVRSPIPRYGVAFGRPTVQRTPDGGYTFGPLYTEPEEIAAAVSAEVLAEIREERKIA